MSFGQDDDGYKNGPRKRLACGEVVIPLFERKDRNQQTYFVSWPDPPILVDLREAVIFVFTQGQPCISIRRKENAIMKEPRAPRVNDEDEELAAEHD